MRRFRRRKARVVWLPQPGTERAIQGVSALAATENPSWAEFAFTVTNGNAPTTVEVPMVVDQPTSADLSSTASLAIWRDQSLQKVNQPTYRLRRIVGEFFGAVTVTDAGNTATGGILLAIGAIVRRVDSDGLVAVDGVDQDLNSIQNNADPWIFRRTWVLGSGLEPVTGPPRAVSTFPGTTAAYGNARAHIDQKTIRKIGPEERLILNATAWIMPSTLTALPDSGLTVWGCFDYRALASIGYSSGNRGNSTR